MSEDMLQFALLHFAAASCYRAPPRAKTCPLDQFPLLAKMCLCLLRTRRPPVTVEGYDFKNNPVYTPRLSCTSRRKREIPECVTNVLLPLDSRTQDDSMTPKKNTWLLTAVVLLAGAIVFGVYGGPGGCGCPGKRTENPTPTPSPAAG